LVECQEIALIYAQITPFNTTFATSLALKQDVFCDYIHNNVGIMFNIVNIYDLNS